MISVRLATAACLCGSLLTCGDISGVDGSSSRKVLLIGLDGVRVDVLARAHTPNIDSLITHGIFSSHAQTRAPTMSGHGWSNMLTGVWANKHLVTSNDSTGNDFATYPDFLTRLEHIDSTFNTLAVVSRSLLPTLLGDAIDVKRTFNSDSASASWAATALENLDFDAVFVYLPNIDGVGHQTSSLDPEYRRAIEIADQQVGQLIAALTRRPTFDLEDWLILISTDHGWRDHGHAGGSKQERTIFYLASGPSTVGEWPFFRRPNIVDVAVTALSHLGIDLEGQLDGRVVGLR